VISVVVLNFNGKHYLDRCISSLRDQTYEVLDVIMVDNSSSDGSVGVPERAASLGDGGGQRGQYGVCWWGQPGYTPGPGESTSSP
jgi:GT2 family glycosyltransferase